MDWSLKFSLLPKGGHFQGNLYTCWRQQFQKCLSPLANGVSSKRIEFAFQGSIFFPFRVETISESAWSLVGVQVQSEMHNEKPKKKNRKITK